MRIGIRADASLQIGSGHVMRCLALARALRARGAEILFLTRRAEGDLFDRVAREGWAIVELPSGGSPPASPSHGAWLGSSLEVELEGMDRALAGSPRLDWLLVDHYALDATWESAMRDRVGHLAVIDDLMDRPHACDLLVDCNLRPGSEGYRGLVPETCLCLLGPKFALLRPEFRQEPVPATPGSPTRLLVFMGGADPLDATGFVLRALSSRPSRDLDVDVVIGDSNPHRAEIESLVQERPGITLHVQTPDLAGLMARADLMIGAPGGATWERCALCLPAILISFAENQSAPAHSARIGRFAWYLGDLAALTTDRLAASINRLLARPSLLRRMAQRGRRFVDGWGAERVAAALLPNLRLAIASAKHSWMNEQIPILIRRFEEAGHTVSWVHDVADLPEGDCAFLLACEQMADAGILRRNAHTLVVHESDLPRGRGWSPLTWQVLAGAREIPVTLFEAQASGVDNGPIYAQERISLEGHELVDELRTAQAAATFRLCLSFVEAYPGGLRSARPQTGTPTYLPRRRPEDSRLDPALSLEELFNQLRVADNHAYPAFFDHAGHRYELKIRKIHGALP